MSKAKSITDLVKELQQENERLKGLEKLFDKAVKQRLGKSLSELENDLKKGPKMSKFEAEISKYFGLKTEADKERFIGIICSEVIMNHYKKKITPAVKTTAENAPAAKQG